MRLAQKLHRRPIGGSEAAAEFGVVGFQGIDPALFILQRCDQSVEGLARRLPDYPDLGLRLPATTGSIRGAEKSAENRHFHSVNKTHQGLHRQIPEKWILKQ
ncbi:hypothetical protein [Jiella pelagia]|uniref:Uncharacterized protein n=1 Tax=Jiella pelagia TaxID=2986949 RepID=A0ABY7C221_9HYPH|nr:hypothetical protein [Jiella pelagia]WAP69079.1 hypothetical protein OH818_01715 [Jiella pelagia]